MNANSKIAMTFIAVMSTIAATGCGCITEWDSPDVIIEESEETDGLTNDKTVTSESKGETEEPEESSTSDSSTNASESKARLSSKDDIPKAYLDILEREYNFILEHDNDFIIDESNGGIGFPESVFQMDVETAMQSLGYCLIDLDQNGIDELIVVDRGGIFGDTLDRILQIYTIENNEAVFVLDGWIRNRYYLLDDGNIYHEGSGGAAYSLFGTYQYADGVVVPIDYYFSDYEDDTDVDSWGWYYNTSGDYSINVSERLDISAEEAVEMQETYLEHAISLDVHFFKDFSAE